MIPNLRITRAAIAALPLLLGCATVQAADGCDALAARTIRATGASLAGRAASLAVFRAADADRLSLDCRTPRRILVGTREREPRHAYFVLVGLAAQGLTGARAEAVETLALVLHQESLLDGAPRQGRIGRAALRCETGPRPDGLSEARTVCVVAETRAASPRRRAGLPVGGRAG